MEVTPANRHSGGGGHRQDAREPLLSAPPPLNRLQRKPARPPVSFPQCSVSTGPNAWLTRRIPLFVRLVLPRFDGQG